jgi:hypothetical protein
MGGDPGDLLDPDSDTGVAAFELRDQLLDLLAFAAEGPETQGDVTIAGRWGSARRGRGHDEEEEALPW